MEQKPTGPIARLALTAVALAVLTVTLIVPPQSAAGPTVTAMAPGVLTGLKPAAGAAQPEQEPAGQRLVPMGCAVGIKLFCDGVLVVGMGEGETAGSAMGLQPGDVITHINDTEVDTIEQTRALLGTLAGQPLTLRIDRQGSPLTLTGTLPDGQLGVWIRDSMAGIGTMTYYDPATQRFGALGHGINDVDTARLMTMTSGSIMPAEVTAVRRGEKGKPGELHGSFQVEQDLGQLYANTGAGVFGTLGETDLAGQTQPLPVAKRSQVHTGRAAIRSAVTGDGVEEYEVEIVRIYPRTEGERRNLMVKVTDKRLLDCTGGIVQGMSGSPIIQDGRLVGAVTHVLVNDPTRGYGILMETMLDAAG